MAPEPITCRYCIAPQIGHVKMRIDHCCRLIDRGVCQLIVAVKALRVQQGIPVVVVEGECVEREG
ncbi:MAG: hypothetical protein ACYTBJ_25315 [Planctomycetota bacterium]|jgi:hypothetical protein